MLDYNVLALLNAELKQNQLINHIHIDRVVGDTIIFNNGYSRCTFEELLDAIRTQRCYVTNISIIKGLVDKYNNVEKKLLTHTEDIQIAKIHKNLLKIAKVFTDKFELQKHKGRWLKLRNGEHATYNVELHSDKLVYKYKTFDEYINNGVFPSVLIIDIGIVVDSSKIWLQYDLNSNMYMLYSSIYLKRIAESFINESGLYKIYHTNAPHVRIIDKDDFEIRTYTAEDMIKTISII